MENRALGDFVEHDALGLGRIQFEHLIQMPGNGFPFAILIGCQPDEVGLLGGFGELGYQGFLVGLYLVFGSEPVFDVYAEVPFGQIPDVPEAGKHMVVFAEEFLYGLGFGRRLYDD